MALKDFNSRPAWILLWLGMAAAYSATGYVCVALSAQVANVSWTLYIPAGLSLAAALLWGSRVWPGIFAGELLMCILTGESAATSLLMAFGNGLDAALAGWLFHDRLGRRIELDRFKDVIALLGAQLIVLQPLCTAIGMTALHFAGHLPPGRLPSTAAAWYSANLYAEFIAAPAALGWLRWPRPASGRAQYAELLLLAVLTLAVGAFGPGRWAFGAIPLPVTLILVFPLLAWASIRFVPSVAISVGTVLGMFAFEATLAGLGPFRGATFESQMVSLNFFMSVTIGTGLFLAAALGNNRRLEADQSALIAKLQASIDQVTRLEEFVTFCAWSGQVRWKDKWVSVETFLRERYNLNISHGISDEALRRLLAEMEAPAPGETAEKGQGTASA